MTIWWHRDYEIPSRGIPPENETRVVVVVVDSDDDVPPYSMLPMILHDFVLDVSLHYYYYYCPMGRNGRINDDDDDCCCCCCCSTWNCSVSSSPNVISSSSFGRVKRPGRSQRHLLVVLLLQPAIIVSSSYIYIYIYIYTFYKDDDGFYSMYQ